MQKMDKPIYNGVLAIVKESGPTSHDVVAKLRRIVGMRRIGHCGTLDPLATGLLVVCLGRYTRLADLLSAGTKEYEAILSESRLGPASCRFAGGFQQRTIDAIKRGSIALTTENRTADILLESSAFLVNKYNEGDLTECLNKILATSAESTSRFVKNYEATSFS